MQLPSPFNARAVQPASADGGGFMPLGEHPVVITASEITATKDNSGGFLALTLSVIDGPAKGQSGIYRLNLYNANAQAVQIAQRQLSAICYVTGVFDVTDTQQLHGKPFVAIVESQNDQQHPARTQVKGVKDMQGNDPGKSAGAAPAAAPSGPPAGFPAAQPAAAAWAAPAPAQQPAAAPAWGGNGAAAPAQPAAPAAPAGWQQPQTAAPAWAGAAPAGAAPAGNAPPWGQR